MSEDKTTGAKEIRDKGQRKVKSPNTGYTYLIRDYCGTDSFRLDAWPDMVERDEEKPDGTEDDEWTLRVGKFNLEWYERIIELCCLEPRFTRHPHLAGDDVLLVSEIGDDITWLGEQCTEKMEGKAPESQSSEPPSS